ncbi:MAG: hypothetical protein LBG58_01245 [Planctomycetaceae bacterium]|jgi:hypothetical protein|nr:hypothetical protein [Planctomycetaceae bacterium]
MEISAWGTILGLVIAIVLIVFRVVPAYSLIAGAFVILGQPLRLPPNNKRSRFC